MNFAHKSHILIIVKFIVTMALLLLIAQNVELQRIFTILDDFDTVFFLLAVVILLLQTMIATIRWRIVLSEIKVEFSFTRVLSFLWIGLFFNQALPSSVGGDAFRGYCVYKNGYSIGKSSLGVLLDRMFGMVGLVVLIVVSLPLMFDLINDKDVQWGVFFVIMSVFAAISSSLMLDLLPKKMAHSRIIQGLFAFSKEGRRQILTIYPGVMLLVVSIVIHSISIIAVVVLSIGMSLDLEWHSMLFIVPFVTLASAIPISIAGWGVREGIMVVSLGYLGVAPEQALVLSILYGVLMLVSSIPGLIIWLKGDYSSSNK